MIITFGGALFAVKMTGDSFHEFIDGIHSLGKAFSKPKNNLDKISEQIFELSSIARKEGLLALEERTQEIENPFFCKGIRLTVDGGDPELIKDILETKMINYLDENAKNEGVLSIHAGENPAVIKEKIRAFRNGWNEQGALPDAS